MSIIKTIVLAWGDVFEKSSDEPFFIQIASIFTAVILLIPTSIILSLSTIKQGMDVVYKPFITALVIALLCPIFYRWICNTCIRLYKEACDDREKLKGKAK